MRILVVHNYYQHRGGEDVVFEQEVQALRKEHQVETIIFENKKGLEGLIQFALYPWNIFAANKILRKAQDFKADIVHIHNLHYAIGPLVFRKLHRAGFKTVQTLHNFRLICPSASLFFDGHLFTSSIHENFPFTALRKKVLDHSYVKTLVTGLVYYIHKKIKTWNKVDRFIVLSDFAKNIFTSSKIGIEKNKFVVKPNFIPQPLVTNSTKNNRFIYIGRLSEEKGIIPLLTAMQNTDHQLLILGTGPQLTEVLEFCSKNDNLKYGGFLPKEQVSEELNNSEALIVPSVCYEGMPMSILESYALGVPVISSDIGILKEIIKQDITGLHFDIYNKVSVLNTLQYWTNISKEEKEKISQNCTAEYQKYYTESQNINILDGLYSSLIKKN